MIYMKVILVLMMWLNLLLISIKKQKMKILKFYLNMKESYINKLLQ